MTSNIFSRVIIFMILLSLAVVFSAEYWISRFIAKADLRKTTIISFLEDIDVNSISCSGCTIFEIDKSYKEFNSISGTKILFLGVWNITSDEDKTIKVSVWKSSKAFNITQTILGIGYLNNSCNLSFYNISGIQFVYNNKYLCIYDYTSGSYSEYVFDNYKGSSDVIVFLWIPVVMEDTTLSMGSYVYLVE